MIARIALRDLRGGLGSFTVLLICLALGVAAIAAVGGVREAIDQGLRRQAAVLLGGDAEMEFTYRYATPEERAFMDGSATAVSEIVDFRSMVTPPSGERALVQVKAVDGAYPLYGTVGLAGGGALAEALAPRDGLPGLVAEGVLIDRLGLRLGDTLRLGTQDFRLTDRLTLEPDGAASGFGLGPRIIVRRADLASSGLLSEGSLFESSYRLRLPPETDLAALRAEAMDRFTDHGLQWKDRRNGAPGIDRFVDRLGAFLVLIGLAGLAVGGVGVSAAVRSWIESKTETIATLKTLGATGQTIFTLYFLQIALLCAAGIAIGLLLGAAAPLIAAPFVAGRLPVPAEFGLYARPLIEAGLYGALTALIFTIWPLARAMDIRAAELFRDITIRQRRWPAPLAIGVVLVLIAALVGLAALLSGVPELALGTAAGVMGALALLFLAALALGALARRAARGPLVRGRPALRWALAALGGPSGETASVVLSLGLGLTVLASIGQIDTNLRNLVTSELPDRAPAYFFVDIQKDRLPDFTAAARAIPGVSAVETAPMLRGVITRVNDRPAREVAGEHWALRGDRGVSYDATPPPGTVITQGQWWAPDYAGPPLVSFGEEQAKELGLKLGDRITVNILGRDLTATIANFRRVEFQSMGINFLMIVDLAALAGAPHTHIATVYAEPAAEPALLRAIAKVDPGITAIGVRAAIEQVEVGLRGVSAAARWGASATLLTGLVVLIGAAAAGERRRVYEAAVLKTLGADRRKILLSFALRSALIGLAAGLVAIGAGTVAGWWVTAEVMDTRYRFAPGSALGIVLGGALATLLAGLAFALRPLSAKPAQVLRARE